MLPPNELKHKDFTRVVRGYSIPEVDEYIDFLLEKYAQLFAECDRLEKGRAEAKNELDAQRREIQTVKNTLIAAQRASEQVVADANSTKVRVMAQTREECEKIIANYDEQIEDQRRQLARMKKDMLRLKNELFEKYATHIQFVEDLTMELPSQISEIDAAAHGASTRSVRAMVHEKTEEEYVSETYNDIPQVLTEQAKTGPIFSDPDAKRISLPEEDPTPTTEMPSLTPQPTANVGGAKISSVKRSVRALNEQFDEGLNDSADGDFGSEDEFLKFLAAHGEDEAEKSKT